MVSLVQCANQVSAIQLRALSPIDSKEHDELVVQLDCIKTELDRFEKKSLSHVFFQHLKDQVIALYGAIDDCLLSHEVNIIQQETHQLQQCLKKKNLKKIAQTAYTLRHHIAKLWENYCPSLHHRRLIALAEEQLEQINCVLKESCDTSTCLSEEERLQTEASLALIGSALCEGDEKRAAYLFNSLNEGQKRLLCNYLPQEDRAHLVGQMDTKANNNKIFLVKR